MDLFNKGNLFATNKPKKTEFDLPDANVIFYKNFFSPEDSNRLYNDYQSLQKIIKGVEYHNSDDLKLLFADIKTLFLSDGEYDIMERNMFLYLKKILS